MYGCESWTIKKAEHWRIDAFELWCWRRLMIIPWTARRSNQSILKEISPEYSLKGLILKLQYLATWCEELTHWKRPWCWERLKAGGEGDNRGWDSWMASLTQWTRFWASSGRNLYAGQEATTGHGTTDWFQIGKGVRQGCILSPCLFNFYAEYIMRDAGLEEAQAGIKIARRNINHLRYADDTTLMAESEEELKSLWWKWKRRVKKLA